MLVHCRSAFTTNFEIIIWIVFRVLSDASITKNRPIPIQIFLYIYYEVIFGTKQIMQTIDIKLLVKVKF